MNVHRGILLFFLLCLVSCAPVGSGLRIDGDSLTCDSPSLSLHFKKDIADIQTRNADRAITFYGGDPRPLMIEFLRIPHSTTLDYYYSLPEIASNMNYYYLESAHFGGKEWIKIAKYIGEDCNCLRCSYFTRKDNDFIMISTLDRNISKSEANDFAEYSRTLKMSEQALARINEQYDYLNEIVEIMK